ncbi:MAG: hypothetical protein K8R69_05315 [Deltaproteobacteria bacterium]|nr:hypothetical protein [Deltaproteobacteria bacterium]
MKRFATFLALNLLWFASCHRAPSPDRPSEKTAKPSGKSLESKDLTLKKGLKLEIVQESGALKGKTRTLTVENPNGAEGLSFQWNLEEKNKGGTESQGQPPLSAENDGTMTLANTVDGRRMTLPAFWPGGELFMSNSSAIWLSDRAFSELKNDGKTQWAIGLLDNPLLGPLQGNELIEKSLEATTRGLDNQPEKKSAAQEIKVTDKSADYPIKINGIDGEVQVIEAENWLAQLKILDNAQNPIILEVEVAPGSKAADGIFSPLSWIRGWLSYRVTGITLP